ncbi:MAG: hypothetical protein D6E12_00540 [Desulfovibrio sp.]|nr:MAG: hypothetical protein D6E12_00540 [Desulfovibrio sp.]
MHQETEKGKAVRIVAICFIILAVCHAAFCYPRKWEQITHRTSGNRAIYILGEPDSGNRQYGEYCWHSTHLFGWHQLHLDTSLGHSTITTHIGVGDFTISRFVLWRSS